MLFYAALVVFRVKLILEIFKLKKYQKSKKNSIPLLARTNPIAFGTWYFPFFTCSSDSIRPLFN